MMLWCCFLFKQKTAYEMLISDWSSDVCSSDLNLMPQAQIHGFPRRNRRPAPLPGQKACRLGCAPKKDARGLNLNENILTPPQRLLRLRGSTAQLSDLLPRSLKRTIVLRFEIDDDAIENGLRFIGQAKEAPPPP